jgi:hypothetical protein
MAIGQSNRIVIDLDDVELKRNLYSALAQDGRSLKDWFIDAANHYLSFRPKARQLQFGDSGISESKVDYSTSDSARSEK